MVGLWSVFVVLWVGTWTQVFSAEVDVDGVGQARQLRVAYRVSQPKKKLFDLPPEILYGILDYLSWNELMCFRRVSCFAKGAAEGRAKKPVTRSLRLAFMRPRHFRSLRFFFETYAPHVEHVGFVLAGESSDQVLLEPYIGAMLRKGTSTISLTCMEDPQPLKVPRSFFSQLRDLDLGGTSTELVREFYRQFSRCTHLRTLSVSHTAIDKLDIICLLLQLPSTVVDLDLSDVGMSSDILRTLLNLLKYRNIQTLGLSNNPLGALGAEMLALELKHDARWCPSLRYINLFNSIPFYRQWHLRDAVREGRKNGRKSVVLMM